MVQIHCSLLIAQSSSSKLSEDAKMITEFKYCSAKEMFLHKVNYLKCAEELA